MNKSFGPPTFPSKSGLISKLFNTSERQMMIYLPADRSSSSSPAVARGCAGSMYSVVQIQPRKHVLSMYHADYYTAHTRQYDELDHTDHTDQETIYLPGKI